MMKVTILQITTTTTTTRMTSNLANSNIADHHRRHTAVQIYFTHLECTLAAIYLRCGRLVNGDRILTLQTDFSVPVKKHCTFMFKGSKKSQIIKHSYIFIS